MNNFILVPYSKNEFRDLIKDSVGELLAENSSKHKSIDNYLNLKEASEFLNLAKPTIYTLTSKRLIPFMKKGKKLYFKKSELEKWLNEGKKKTISELENEKND